MSDVLLFQTNDDGDITIEDGFVELTDDFRTSAYLSLFGGNEQDDGRDDNPLTWWANLNETNPSKRYVSETEHLLQSLPVTSGNLLRLQDAALRDLQFFKNIGAVSEIAVEISLVALNRLKYVITLNGDETVEFTQNWKAFE